MEYKRNPAAAKPTFRQPRDTIFSALLSELCVSALYFLLYFADALFERAHGKVRLLFVNHERRRKTERIFSRAEYEQALVERHIHNRVAQISCALLGPLIAHDFDANHQPASANVADNLELFGPIGDLLKNVVAHFLRIHRQAALKQIEGSNRGCEANRIPAER